MATIIPTREGSTAEALPPLYDGQRLSQPEFHRLYETCPKDQKFELVDGIVYMAAAYRRTHSRLGYLVGATFCAYEAATPGVEGLANATTIFDEKNEPEPDLQMRILREHGGRSDVTSDQYISGPPELIIEISHSTLNLDLKKKSVIYQEQGVREYVVVDVEAAKFHWLLWPEGERPFDLDGIFRSIAFPGLWIDSQALFQEQIANLLATLNQGILQPEHAAFVAKLKSNAQK